MAGRRGGGTEKSWPGIVLDSWLLGAEAWMVVGLRVARLANGGQEACREARLMIDEKVESTLKLNADLAAGRLGTTPKAVVGNTVTHFLDGVRANRKRLSRR